MTEPKVNPDTQEDAPDDDFPDIKNDVPPEPEEGVEVEDDPATSPVDPEEGDA